MSSADNYQHLRCQRSVRIETASGGCSVPHVIACGQAMVQPTIQPAAIAGKLFHLQQFMDGRRHPVQSAGAVLQFGSRAFLLTDQQLGGVQRGQYSDCCWRLCGCLARDEPHLLVDDPSGFLNTSGVVATQLVFRTMYLDSDRLHHPQWRVERFVKVLKICCPTSIPHSAGSDLVEIAWLSPFLRTSGGALLVCAAAANGSCTVIPPMLIFCGSSTMPQHSIEGYSFRTMTRIAGKPGLMTVGNYTTIAVAKQSIILQDGGQSSELPRQHDCEAPTAPLLPSRGPISFLRLGAVREAPW